MRFWKKINFKIEFEIFVEMKEIEEKKIRNHIVMNNIYLHLIEMLIIQ